MLFSLPQSANARDTSKAAERGAAVLTPSILTSSILTPSILTPYGAERKGNIKGTIPEWTGGITQSDIPKEYSKPGQYHPNPYKDDKPLYKITADNMQLHTEKLSVGLQGLLKTYPKTFYVPVYATRRSASAPQRIYDNIAKNRLTAELTNAGSGISNAFGGVAFPLPYNESGEVEPLKILWNHLTRWRGVYVKSRSADVVVQKNGAYSLVTSEREYDFLYYHEDGDFNGLANRLYNSLLFIKSPARMAGGALLVQETIDQLKDSRRVWGYSSTQRRVRKAPVLTYDTLTPSAEGLVTIDDLGMFNGSPDHFDWTFVGKREMLIPYNNYALDDPSLKHETLLMKGHVDPASTRYELHRVWVIEATVKDNISHLYSRRMYYVDEDSWSIALVDQYDAQGGLWRTTIAYLMNFYEVPALWSVMNVYHDLVSERYFASLLDADVERSMVFDDKAPPPQYFKPAALRRRGR